MDLGLPDILSDTLSSDSDAQISKDPISEKEKNNPQKLENGTPTFYSSITEPEPMKENDDIDQFLTFEATQEMMQNHFQKKQPDVPLPKEDEKEYQIAGGIGSMEQPTPPIPVPQTDMKELKAEIEKILEENSNQSSTPSSIVEENTLTPDIPLIEVQKSEKQVHDEEPTQKSNFAPSFIEDKTPEIPLIEVSKPEKLSDISVTSSEIALKPNYDFTYYAPTSVKSDKKEEEAVEIIPQTIPILTQAELDAFDKEDEDERKNNPNYWDSLSESDSESEEEEYNLPKLPKRKPKDLTWSNATCWRELIQLQTDYLNNKANVIHPLLDQIFDDLIGEVSPSFAKLALLFSVNNCLLTELQTGHCDSAYSEINPIEKNVLEKLFMKQFKNHRKLVEKRSVISFIGTTSFIYDLGNFAKTNNVLVFWWEDKQWKSNYTQSFQNDLVIEKCYDPDNDSNVPCIKITTLRLRDFGSKQNENLFVMKRNQLSSDFKIDNVLDPNMFTKPVVDFASEFCSYCICVSPLNCSNLNFETSLLSFMEQYQQTKIDIELEFK